MTFTHGGIAKAFGSTPRSAHQRAPQHLPRTPASSLGSNDPGRIRDFMQGVKEARDERSKHLLEVAGVFVGIQAWSAWKNRKRP